MSNEKDLLFQEEQPFRQIWVLLIIGFAVIMSWVGVICQVILKIPVGKHPPDIVLILNCLVIGIFLPLCFYLIKLITEVRSDGIYFKFHLLHKSFCKINFDDIKSYEAVTYNPLFEYGGWGIRRNFSGKKKAYNVYGNKGVQFELKRGEKILIGSQKPDELFSAVEKGMNKK